MIAWWLPSLVGAAEPAGVEEWMNRCFSGDADACERLSIAAAVEEAGSGVRSKEGEAAIALDRWALDQRCRAGDGLACVAVDQRPAACVRGSWAACHDALRAAGAGDLPMVVRAEPDAFDVAGSPLIDPALVDRVHVLDALSSRRGLTLLVEVRYDDPSESALFAPDWRYGIAELRRGRWTTRSLPNLPELRWDWGDEPMLLETGGALFAHDDALVEWTPEGTAVKRANLWPDRGHDGSWDVAGSWTLVRHERFLVRIDGETSRTERWDADAPLIDSDIAPDGTAWLVVEGKLLRWGADDAAPEAFAVDGHRVVDRQWNLQEAGAIAHVWAGPEGLVVVQREPRFPLFWFDAAGHEVFRGGDAEAASFGLAWGPPEPAPRWARKRPPLTLPLPPAASDPPTVPVGSPPHIETPSASGSWTVVAVAADGSATPGAPLGAGTTLYAIGDDGIFQAAAWSERGSGGVVPAWRALSLTPTVVADATGRPRPGVRVKVALQARTGVIGSYDVWSDAAGSVSLPDEADIVGKNCKLRISGTHVTPAPPLDVDAAPTRDALRAQFVGRWLAPPTPTEWVVTPKGRGLVVTREGRPMRVIGVVGADLWVTAEGSGPRQIWRLNGGDPTLLVVATGSGTDTSYTVLQRQP